MAQAMRVDKPKLLARRKIDLFADETRLDLLTPGYAVMQRETEILARVRKTSRLFGFDVRLFVIDKTPSRRHMMTWVVSVPDAFTLDGDAVIETAISQMARVIDLDFGMAASRSTFEPYRPFGVLKPDDCRNMLSLVPDATAWAMTPLTYAEIHSRRQPDGGGAFVFDVDVGRTFDLDTPRTLCGLPVMTTSATAGYHPNLSWAMCGNFSHVLIGLGLLATITLYDNAPFTGRELRLKWQQKIQIPSDFVRAAWVRV